MRPSLVINSPDRLPRFELWIFLASGALVLVVSSPLLAHLELSLATIVFIYLLPWVMLWPTYSFEVIKSRAYRGEIIFIGTIIVFGIFNIIFSDSPYNSFQTVRIFLLSGILPFWTSLFIFQGQYQRDYFNYFSCLWLLLIAASEIIVHDYSIDVFIFLHNAIPVGSLVILLSSGPLGLLLTRSSVKKAVGLVGLAAGLSLIGITQKRGPWLAVAAMALAWILQRLRRPLHRALVVLAVAAVLLPAGWLKYQALDYQKPPDSTILHRLELAPFALHVFQKHPIWGTGLRSFTQHNYLSDYSRKNSAVTHFAADVAKLQTFDNMFLTAWVEMGILMTLAYLGLIIYVLTKYWRNLQPGSRDREAHFILLLPLIGLAVHSLTYDSLLFPQINWLFHVQLGILAAYQKVA